MEPTYTQNTQQTAESGARPRYGGSGLPHAEPDVTPAERPYSKTAPAQQSDSFELSDGTTVEFVPASVSAWMRARKLAGDDLINSSFYCLAEIARFNGEKKTLQEIKELPICDGLLLESKFNELCAGKK